MPKLAISIVLLLFSISCFSQLAGKEIIRQNRKNRISYLAVSSGINNINGHHGYRLNLELQKNLLVGLHAGWSNWGARGGVQIGYKTKNNLNPFVAFTRSSGKRNALLKLEGQTSEGYGKYDVKVDLLPATTINAGFEKVFKLGNNLKAFIDFGYSFRINPKIPIVASSLAYQETIILSSASVNYIEKIAPGGILLAVGFGIAL